MRESGPWLAFVAIAAVVVIAYALASAATNTGMEAADSQSWLSTSLSRQR